MKGLKGIGEFLHELDELVFPSSIYCICCGSMIDSSRSYSLCDECIHKMHWNTGAVCSRCGKALQERNVDPAERLCYDCMVQLPFYNKGFSCVTYGFHERELMMDLKYGGHGHIARRCGDMMFDRIECEIQDGLFSPAMSPIDIITPVPISAVRFSERGYNQSALMASQLAKRWRAFVAHGVPKDAGFRAPVFYENMLYRTRETRKLRGLNPAERAMELEGVFKVKKSYMDRICGMKDRENRGDMEKMKRRVSRGDMEKMKSWEDVEKRESRRAVENRRGAGALRVLLIDDIQTTNATANACTKALLDAGASEVFFLSWASGGNRKPADV